MKIKKVTKNGIAVITGIAGGLIFLLFLFFGIGVTTNDLFILTGLFGTVIFTMFIFLLLNYDGN